MNKALLYIFIILLITGCKDSRVTHYENGGTLLCKKNKLFSKDIYRTISKYNSNYIKSSIEGMLKMPEGFKQNNLFFKIDECKIK
jgi:hypothetical protein